MKKINLAISGCLGRMGQQLIKSSKNNVEEMYAPITGEVVQRNEAVLANPEELQNDPHGEGWLLVIRPSDPAQIGELMDSATYTAKVAAA